MKSWYSEEIPDDIAHAILGEAYQKDCVYSLVSDADKSCITARKKDTGEHVDLVVSEDGIGDDFILEEDEHELCDKEMEEYEDDSTNDYSYARLGIWTVIIPVTMTVLFLSVLYFGYKLLW